MYSEKVMDHFQHPRNVGEIENASGVGTVGNAKCGDIMRIYFDIDENQVIRDVKFKTFGCGAAVATSSMATELVKGKTIYEALEVTNKAVMEALDGLPHEIAHGSLRLTLGYDNTQEEIDGVVDEIEKIVARLRSMSPLYEDFIKKTGGNK